MANGEITLLNFNNVTYQGSSTLSCGPIGVIQIKPEFCIGDNGDTTRQPDLSFHLNYVSGKWCAGAVDNWICNESPSTVNELNFRDSSFPRTKPSNIQFTDGTNGEHLANGVTWFADAADTKYTTHVEQLGVGTGTTVYETSTYDTIFTNNTNKHICFEQDGTTALYNNGTQKLCTHKNGVTVSGSLLADALTVGNIATAGVIQWCDTGGDLYIYNKDTSAASDIFINPVAGSVDLYFCNALKMCTVSTGICVIGSVSCGSDSRIKDVIGNISDPIDIINNLCAIKYTSKITNDNCVHLGYIAQEVKSILPEVVSSSNYKEESYIGEIYKSLGIEDEVYGIDYGGIIPVLSEAIKIQQTCINNLETRLSTLENS